MRHAVAEISDPKRTCNEGIERQKTLLNARLRLNPISPPKVSQQP